MSNERSPRLVGSTTIGTNAIYSHFLCCRKAIGKEFEFALRCSPCR